MAAISGTGVALSANYYLRNFYTTNRDARTTSKRKEMTNHTLSSADAAALRRAAKALRNFNYEDDTTDTANIYGSISAFIATYNNTLSSGSSSSDATLNRYAKYMKSLSKNHSGELSKIGITVKADGSLDANENLLKSAKSSKLKKVFGNDAEYITKMNNYAKKMSQKADAALLAEGVGGTIDLSL